VYRGWAGLGHRRANGPPNGGPWRQFHGTSGGGYVFETHGTIFSGKRISVELIVRVIACLAEGLGIGGTARVFEVDPNTVLGWLVEAAEQLRALSRYFLHDLHLTQVPLDEWYAVLSAVKDGAVSEDDAIERLSRSPHWVWTAMDPESTLWVPGSNRAKTYGKAHCQGETFPTTRLFGKVYARSHWYVKDLYRVAPSEPYIIFGKVPNTITVSV